jgi:hypothetical protein
MLLSFLNGKRADDSESCMQSAVQKMFSWTRVIDVYTQQTM